MNPTCYGLIEIKSDFENGDYGEVIQYEFYVCPKGAVHEGFPEGCPNFEKCKKIANEAVVA